MYSRELLIDHPSPALAQAGDIPSLPLNATQTAAAHRVLVVDDHSTIRQLVADMIQRLGHFVDTAENGTGALNKISNSGYDLVLADLEMPVMNGYNLAARIKSLSSRTKTIIMTGRCQAEVHNLMVTSVVDAWLFKPFNLIDLNRQLREINLCRA